MAQKITHWLLITLVLSLGFGQLLRFEVFGLPLYFHDILVICILLLQGPSLQNYGLKIFLLGLTLGWCNALFHYPITQLLIPFLYTLRLLAYLVLFFRLKSLKFYLPNFAYLIAGFTTLILGLTQYFLMPDMRVFQYLGWDDHLNRLIMPHFDPTFTGVMLGLFLLSQVNLKFPYLILNTVYIIPALLLTYSRSVWLSFVLTLVFFVKNKLVLLLAVSCLLLAIILLPQRFGEGTNLLRTYSISSRLESDLNYVHQYQWDLLLGRGLNTLILDQGVTHATGPNNSYLYLLLTSGIFGLVGWMMFMLSLYRQSSYKPLLVFFFLASLFNNVMFYPFALLWILLVQFRVPSAT
ncbi:MAG: hypothetical protein V1487_01275 [bacterium]